MPGFRAAGTAPATGDERHFAAIAAGLDQAVADLVARLDDARRAPGGIGQQALERDLEVHRLSARRGR
ncbi:MAG: hypothetical protein ACYCO9_09725 [Streptosporangiaceae bacterium]